MGKAKRGGVFGMIRGSVGPATYSIGKDGAGKKQQIVREKPVEVANPRTRAQAIQRMKMVPITYAMGLLSDIVDHSFVGVQEGWPSKRHFMSLAMRENDIPFIPKGSLNRAIGGYVISEGTVGRVSPFNVVCSNVSLHAYGKNLPAILFWKGVDEYGYFSSGNVSWADISANLIANSNGLVQDGDEIAVLAFVTKNTPSAQGLQVVKRRMLIDTNFTRETPDDFKFTAEVQGVATTWDLNVLYAFSLYNEGVDISAFKQESMAVTSRAGVVGVDYFISLMGLLNDGDETGVDYLTYLLCPYDSALGIVSRASVCNMVPQTAAEAAQSGKLAAVAMVISRRTDSGFNYTISDIHLTEGYLLSVNNATLMEQAITSYMNGAAAGNSSASDLYLQLSEDEYSNFDVSSFRAQGTVSINDTDTAVYADITCRINPNDGKFIVFVDNNGYATSEGVDFGNALAMRGFRWRNASTGQYVNIDDPFVKVAQITNATNVTFAQEIW